ncbi:carbohydrate kinase family protein [Methanonatronarchaeum sp. AMET-Sl]|uniref:carbohydrate kinase family protein n=1 Tax=Methanonatronarchaeum sp. AMET-Sl TaxID=3037654 RepID=UPI00244DACAF|nr:carbohydrate kinase family protein [Methanonatronarchaeum sp. AMET-Sl]WGI16778.1 carbohydrate kinase family protein [Methanonatronarchaeum sp. AMET-Sl]
MILSVGHTAIDHIFRVPRFPKPDSSIYIEDYKRLYGGGAANVAANIASLGMESSLLSLVGQDFQEYGYEKHLEKIGVNTEHMKILEGKTSNAFVYTDEKDSQITYFYWGASKKFPEQNVPENIDKYDIIHLAPSDPTYNKKIAEKAKYLSFDPGQDLPVYTKKDLKTILKNTDILFSNIHEIKKIKTKTDLTFNEIKKQVETVVVTNEDEGSTIYNEKTIKIPPVPVKAVDPTGAGDAYRAGFLTAIQKGYDLETTGKIASTVASFTVEKIGCQTNLPTWKQTIKRYNKTFNKKPKKK